MICKGKQYSDLMVCNTCKLTWDINDPVEPKCTPYLSKIEDVINSCNTDSHLTTAIKYVMLAKDNKYINHRDFLRMIDTLIQKSKELRVPLKGLKISLVDL